MSVSPSWFLGTLAFLLFGSLTLSARALLLAPTLSPARDQILAFRANGRDALLRLQQWTDADPRTAAETVTRRLQREGWKPLPGVSARTLFGEDLPPAAGALLEENLPIGAFRRQGAWKVLLAAPDGRGGSACVLAEFPDGPPVPALRPDPFGRPVPGTSLACGPLRIDSWRDAGAADHGPWAGILRRRNRASPPVHAGFEVFEAPQGGLWMLGREEEDAVLIRMQWSGGPP